MLKNSNSVNAPDVQAALDTMLSVLKHVNDSIHRKAIVGYQVRSWENKVKGFSAPEIKLNLLK